jgi:ABC-2 type transport system ATP-binding protein
MNRAGTTIVLNSHVLSEIEMVCNRVAIMDRGKVIVQDEMNRLRGMVLETYRVEFDLMEPVPECVRVTVKTPTTIKGEVPVERLTEFVQQVDGSGKRLYECSLKRLSLEDSFFNILKGKNDRQNI